MAKTNKKIDKAIDEFIDNGINNTVEVLDGISKTFDEEDFDVIKKTITSGQYKKTFNIMGDDVVFSTITMGDKIDAELLVLKYANIPSFQHVLSMVQIAASIVSINGEPLIAGIDKNNLQAKFEEIKKWPSEKVNQYFLKYLIVSGVEDAVIQKVIKISKDFSEESDAEKK